MTSFYQRIWKLQAPIDRNQFAGTVPESLNRGPVVDSEAAPSEFIFSWDAGNDIIGDCVWPWADGQITIRTEIAKKIFGRFAGLQLFPAHAVRVPRMKKCIKSSAVNIEFSVLWPTHWAQYDEGLSSVEKRTLFAGIAIPTIVGSEFYDHDYRPMEGINKYRHVPRERGKGIFFHRQELKGLEVFRVKQLPGMIACTDNFRNVFLEFGVSNILFLEIGDLVD